MQKTLLFPIACALLALSFSTAVAQQSPISKLVIAKGETYAVDKSNILVVDTLIMHDKATIKFASGKEGKLGARIAYIGDNCLITAKGADGQNSKTEKPGLDSKAGRPGLPGEAGKPSTDGENGGSLEVDLHFMKLGKLTLDTRGGKGGNGSNGINGRRPYKESNNEVGVAGSNIASNRFVVSGHPAANGKPGTLGGLGGNGGNIKLTYSTYGFLANFNQPQQPRNITILHNGGENGFSGKAGRSYISHEVAVEGTRELTKEKNSVDGTVELIRAN